MCIKNTYTCPSCHRERKETISCVPRYQQQQQQQHQQHQPGTQNSSSATPSLQVPLPTCNDVIEQYLLATCLSCTTAYRAAFEQTLRRSIAMSRQGSGSSNSSGGDADADDPHVKLLEEERRNARVQWQAYGRQGRERICKKIGVTEDEILYM